MAIWNVGYNAAGSALDFTTVAAAQASGSVSNGDTLRLHYSDSTLCAVWYFSNFSVTKALTITFGIGGNVLTVQGDYTASGYLFLVSVSGVVITGINARGATTGVSVAGAYSATVSNCYFDGVSTAVNVNNASASVAVTNCHFAGGFVGVSISAGAVTAYHCTAYGSAVTGFRRIGGTFTAVNCVSVFCGANYTGTFSASSRNNASNDGTYPSATGNVDLVANDAKFLSATYTNTVVRGDYRVGVGSALLSAGYDVGVTADIDGDSFAGNIPIGCSVAKSLVARGSVLTTATPAGIYVPLAAADARPVSFGVGQTGTLANLDGTESAYQTLEASRNTDPGAANVLNTAGTYKILNVTKTPTFDEAARNTGAAVDIIKLGETIKQRNVDYVGTYDPSGTPCAAPTLALAAGNASLVATLTPATGCELIPMYLRYWLSPDGAYSAESESLKRTGTGTVTIPTLTNERVYGVIAYHKDGTKLGYTNLTKYATPTDGTNLPTGIVAGPLGTLRDMLAACSAWQTLTGTGSVEDAKTHIYLEAVPSANAHPTPSAYTGEIAAARPFAVLIQGEDWQSMRIGVGQVEQFSLSGTIRLEFEVGIPTAYQDTTELDGALVWLHRTIGGVLSDLRAQSGLAGNLYLGALQLKDGPFRADDKTKAEQGDFAIVAYDIAWGLGA